MKLLVEVAPRRNRERLLEEVSKLANYVDAVFIPDAPLGKPSAHAIAVAHIVSESLGLEAIPSIRLRDVNTNGLLNLVGAAKILGIRSIVLVRGDPPAHGVPVDDIGTEEAIALLRGVRAFQGIRLGLVVSMAKGYEMIGERLRLPINMALVSRLWRPRDLEHEVFAEARKRGIEIYPYIVVASEARRRAVYEMLRGHQPVYLPREAAKVLEELRGLCDGVLVSSPMDPGACLELLRLVR